MLKHGARASCVFGVLTPSAYLPVQIRRSSLRFLSRDVVLWPDSDGHHLRPFGSAVGVHLKLYMLYPLRAFYAP